MGFDSSGRCVQMPTCCPAWFLACGWRRRWREERQHRCAQSLCRHAQCMGMSSLWLGWAACGKRPCMGGAAGVLERTCVLMRPCAHAQEEVCMVMKYVADEVTQYSDDIQVGGVGLAWKVFSSAP